MISANRVSMLMLSPSASMVASAAMNAVGIPAATQNAVRPLRNTSSTSITRANPVIPLFIRIWIRCFIRSPWASYCSIRSCGG